MGKTPLFLFIVVWFPRNHTYFKVTLLLGLNTPITFITWGVCTLEALLCEGL